MELLDIVSINHNDYVIAKMVTLEDKDYVLLEKIKDEEILTNERFIGQIVVKNGEDAILVVANKDSNEYKNVSRLFLQILGKKDLKCQKYVKFKK